MRHSDDFGLIFSAKVLSLSYSSIPVPQAKACTPAIYLHGAEQIERDSQYPFFPLSKSLSCSGQIHFLRDVIYGCDLENPHFII